MTPLPPPLGPGEWVAWRLDRQTFAATWDSGEGAYLSGGRWNGIGMRAVYCSTDPATAILEVAVHIGFKTLDTLPYALSCIALPEPSAIHVIRPDDVPNPNWLNPGIPSAGQQQFGDALLREHKLILIPSAVSAHSWNLVFDPGRAAGSYELRSQERFALDTRLHPPAHAG